MPFLIALVVLIVGGMMIAGFFGFGLFAYGEHARAKAEERAPAILDAAFDGRENVVYKVNMESVSFETAVLGAKERGYRLLSHTDDTPDGVAKTLIFERV